VKDLESLVERTLADIGRSADLAALDAVRVGALGRKGDVLLAISTSGNSANILAAMRAARELGLRIVALTGNGGGKMAGGLKEEDVHVCVPHTRTMRIQEVHLLALHCFCDGIDTQLYGDKR